jgi:hypothetical protein
VKIGFSAICDMPMYVSGVDIKQKNNTSIINVVRWGVKLSTIQYRKGLHYEGDADKLLCSLADVSDRKLCKLFFGNKRIKKDALTICPDFSFPRGLRITRQIF